MPLSKIKNVRNISKEGGEKMRKILYIVGLATMILINATAVSASNDIYYTNQKNIEMTEQEYTNLLNLGFTENQIDWMSEDIFRENKDIEATLVSHEKLIVKTTTVIRNGIKRCYNQILTQEELEELLSHPQRQQPPAGINVYGNFYDGMAYDSVKEIDMRIAIYDDYYGRLKLDTYWDYIPNYRYNDLSGIYYNSSLVHRAGYVSHLQYYITTSGVHGEDESMYVNTTSNSAVIMFELPSGSLSTLESYMYFTIQKNENIGTITELYATGDYAHAGYSVPTDVINNVTMSSTGLWISNTYDNYYDDMSVAVAHFVGGW